MRPLVAARVAWLASLALALALGLSPACVPSPSWPPSPAPLRAGEEVCAECRMFVTDARFAVQAHARDGAVAWFDDLGCLLAGVERDVAPEAVFVRDFGADAWVRGDQGHAVLVPGLDSPMGYGWSVHASAADARTAAHADDTRIVPLSELLLRGEPDARERADELSATDRTGEERR